MLGTAIIVFREVLEAALIVGIVLAASSGAPGRGRWVSCGIAGGVVGAGLVAAFAASVKVRSHAPLAAAVVTPLGDQARIDFDAPQRALAPGQAAVFYDGDRVIGGGPIAAGDG